MILLAHVDALISEVMEGSENPTGLIANMVSFLGIA